MELRQSYPGFLSSGYWLHTLTSFRRAGQDSSLSGLTAFKSDVTLVNVGGVVLLGLPE